jgi:hypothetical protein
VIGWKHMAIGAGSLALKIVNLIFMPNVAAVAVLKFLYLLNIVISLPFASDFNIAGSSTLVKSLVRSS